MTKNTVPNSMLNDIENHFGNHSISSMGSDLYCVGVDGDYGSYEIMIPANGHCTIKMHKTTKSGRYDNISWYYYSPEWFERCEETQTLNESKTKKNLKKNIIKLNEAQLKKVVAESVQRVLSELDWKTYANAADKRRIQSRKANYDKDLWGKANELDKAASHALSDKYGRKLHTWGDDWNGKTGNRIVMDNSPWTKGSDARGPEPTGYWYKSSKDRDWRDIDNEYQEGDYDEYGDIPFDSDLNNDAIRKQNNEIGREVDNFTHGRYTYDSENGWHLKESKLNVIIAESIKKVLGNLDK